MAQENVVAQLKELRKRLNSGEIDQTTFEQEKSRLLERTAPPPSQPAKISQPPAKEPAQPPSPIQRPPPDPADRSITAAQSERAASQGPAVKVSASIAAAIVGDGEIQARSDSEAPSTEMRSVAGQKVAVRSSFGGDMTKHFGFDFESGNEAADESLVEGDRAPTRPPWLIPAIVVGAVVIVAALVWVVLGSSSSPSTARGVEAAPRKAASPGTLRVEIDPPGKAQLDAFLVPDGGQRSSRSHVFSGLEPRSYTLKVWADGYPPVTRQVLVRSDDTRTETVRLNR